MLDVTASTMSQFVDSSVEALQNQIRRERQDLLAGHNTKRLELVSRLADGDEIPRDSRDEVLGYRLDRTHTALVAWSTEAAPQLSGLEHAIEDVARQVGSTDVLRVLAGPGTVWAWLADAVDVRSEAVERALATGTQCHVAMGPSRRGVDGMRTSHLDAVSTRRMMVRMGSPRRFAAYTDVEGVLLLTRSVDHADRFVADTLGALENGYAELRESVRAYLAQQGRTAQAAERLFIHRNTLLRRLQRADELLPRLIAENALNIGMARARRLASQGGYR